MPRLVTFGCSYTYGIGLNDIYNVPMKLSQPSKYAWPSCLAKQLNFEVCNLSKGGSGNAEIFHKILTTSFNEDDLVVIMWSHFVRYDHFSMDDSEYTGIRRWTWETNPYEKSNFDWHNAYRNYLTFHHAALYLLNKNIRHLAFMGYPPDYESYPKPNYLTIPNFFKVEGYIQDYALDKGHFGIKSHEILADMLYNIIDKNELR